MARTYAYALAGALIATFTVTPVIASLLLPEHVKGAETFVVRVLHRLYNPALRFALVRRTIMVVIGCAFLAIAGLLMHAAGKRVPPPPRRGQFLDSRLHAHDPFLGGR